jgi:hypothetical protein
MAGNAATPIIPRDGVLVVSDNTGTPKTITVPYLNGTLKLTGLNASQRARQIFKSKGVVYAVRDTDDQEFGVEFTCDAVHFKGDNITATLFEALMKLGPWNNAVSTLPPSAGDTFCVTLTWTVERTNFGGTNDNVVVAKYVYFDVDFAEGTPGQFTLKGTGVPYSTDFLTWT